MTLRVLVMPPGDQPRVETLGEDELTGLQQLVGGWIEIVSCGSFDLVVAEEGKVRGDSRNPEATDLARAHRPWAAQQVLVGTAVAVGRAVEAGGGGGFADVPEDLVAQLAGGAR